MLNAENELKKWQPVLEHADAPAIEDSYKKAVTAKLLENTEKAIQEEAAHSSYSLNEDTKTGAVNKFDPVLISLVRRAMPNLIAYDVAGVQPMSGPTGLIFAMEPRFETNSSGASSGNIDTADQAAFAPNYEPGSGTANSGTGTLTGEIGDGYDGSASSDTDAESEAAFTIGSTGLATATGEGAISKEMGFTISKTSVEAKTRQLKAEYTMELAQDLKAIHGLDAEAELANILSGEILGEINREVIRTIGRTAKYELIEGAAASAGAESAKAQFDASSVNTARGRWNIEIYQSLAFQLEKSANKIATDTRRGKGNFAIVSPNVASALAGAGKLTFGGDKSLNVDATGNTFAGLLNGSLKVYVDPYATKDYAIVGYKGSNAYDAGLFYCPYVPLTMVRAVGENTFQPKIAFKTRYGMQANPFVTTSSGVGNANSNQYYRVFGVTGL